MKAKALAVFTLMLVMGAGCTATSSETPAVSMKFGEPTTLSIGIPVQFEDGLSITLKTINDSRCPAGVMCIWAGELSPVLQISGGDLATSSEVTLGSTTKTVVTLENYTLILVEATASTATISVAK